MSTAFGPAAAPLSPLGHQAAGSNAPGVHAGVHAGAHASQHAATSVPSATPAAPTASASAAGRVPAEGPVLESGFARDKIGLLLRNIEAVIVGKREAIKHALIGLFARGHVLIEDVPGVGKTTLARALARSIDCEFRRIQFTPDLLPSDVVGVSIFDQKEGRFRFHPGPLFANVILADEINRTTPRTQSALLEAMMEFQVSVDGTTYRLPNPFIVLATQNPIEYSGTYALPEAQLDRFLLRLSIGYPDRDSERMVLKGQRTASPLEQLKPVITAEEVLAIQAIVRQVAMEDALQDYIIEIASRTRVHKGLALGVSTRGAQMLQRAAQACALIDGRDFCTPDDIKRMAPAVLSHRVIEKGRDTGASRKDADSILREILEEVPVPI